MPEVTLLEKYASKRPTRLKLTKAAKRQMLADPEWADSKDARDMVARVEGSGWGVMEDYFPQDYGKKLPDEGAWIRVHSPPDTEFTVPPLSIWFARPWRMDRPSFANLRRYRVKIVTPQGSLGIMASEYAVIKSPRQYVGRESEGVWLRQLSGSPVVNTDQLFYLMSRGITKQQACLMLIDQIKDDSFLWFEFAPQYGEHFGLSWPSPARCPFATPREKFIEDKPRAPCQEN